MKKRRNNSVAMLDNPMNQTFQQTLRIQPAFYHMMNLCDFAELGGSFGYTNLHHTQIAALLPQSFYTAEGIGPTPFLRNWRDRILWRVE